MKKTDNHYINEKIELRLDVLTKQQKPKILECFAGEGVLWDKIKKQTNIKFSITSIEKKVEKTKMHI